METEKLVFDVGQCSYDHFRIKAVLEPLGVRVLQVHSAQGVFDKIQSHKPYLILVNRILDADGTSGIELLHQLVKKKLEYCPKLLLVSNYDWAQAEVQKFGILKGFGKEKLRTEETKTLLQNILRSDV